MFLLIKYIHLKLKYLRYIYKLTCLLFEIFFLTMFGSVVAFVVVILKKYFIKNTSGWGWFDIYICLVKTVVEIEVEQKVI